MPPPLLIGLTGGIAAGKSEALAAFERLGAATISSDAVVHELLDTPEVRDALVEQWGPEVAPAGTVDRGRISEIVFERPEELAWLEAQVHPRVGERLAAWRESLPASIEVAVVEVPLLFEAAMDAAFDATVAIVADDHVRQSRASARGHPDLEQRERAQLSQRDKAARADHVVRNDGSLAELEQALSELLVRLRPQRRDSRSDPLQD
jgi:dephospho-CoA kinase